MTEIGNKFQDPDSVSVGEVIVYFGQALEAAGIPEDIGMPIIRAVQEAKSV
jgi:hypothetical protein